MNQSESIKELAGALAKAQGAIKAVAKDQDNPFFKSKYADLASVWEAIREPLSKNGLSIVQFPISEGVGAGAMAGVETVLLHSSGEFLCHRYYLAVSKADAQGYGSAITYARRYALMAVVGVAPDDDDGNSASAPAPAAPATQQARVTPPKSAPAGIPSDVVNHFNLLEASRRGMGFTSETMATVMGFPEKPANLTQAQQFYHEYVLRSGYPKADLEGLNADVLVRAAKAVEGE